MAAIRAISCASRASMRCSTRALPAMAARPCALSRSWAPNAVSSRAAVQPFMPRIAASVIPSRRASFVARGAEDGDIVTVNYTGTLDDGAVFDTSLQEGREPLEFTVGAGTVVKGFDKCVMGLEVGETRTLRIDAEDAYGEWSEDNTATFPKENAPEGVIEGAVVGLSNGMQAVVTKLTDTEITIDANHPLAGKALTFEVELMTLKKGSSLETALFGAGCFWGVELNLQRQVGVTKTRVGYSQGDTDSPSYEDVCSGATNHNEVVQVTYDPSELDFGDLCDAFFGFHDPTTLNRQGGDAGTQYRSGIYYTSDAQKEAAEAAMARASSKYSDPIVTEIVPAAQFWDAEEYHQQYLARGGRFGQPQDPSKGCTDPVRCYG